MAKFSFKLRHTSGKSASIQLVCNYGVKKRYRYSTGYIIQDMKNWNAKDMRIKNVATELDRRHINEKLDDLQSKIKTAYYLSVDKDEEVNDLFFKDFCDKYFGKITATKKNIPDLLSFYLWYIDNYKNKPLPSIGRPLSNSTIKTYKSAHAILERFKKAGNNVNYKDVNFKFYTQFIDWLHGEGYSENYIGNQIKTLKTMMKSSFDLEYHENIECEKKYFKKPTEQVDNIYLTQNEIQKIFIYDFSNEEPIMVGKSLKLTPDILDRARDLFIISCNTGLRVSDFNRLSFKNIFTLENGKQHFRIITKKNSRPLTVPINSMVSAILNKHNGNPPQSLPDQHINYALKEIGRLAEINSIETKEITKGGVKLKTEYKKYELISNHTGRRSFCTNAYLSGMPTIDIMAISSHTSEKVFYNYIKVNDLQRANKIGEHPFFK